jgi:hypothetical protein
MQVSNPIPQLRSFHRYCSGSDGAVFLHATRLHCYVSSLFAKSCCSLRDAAQRYSSKDNIITNVVVVASSTGACIDPCGLESVNKDEWHERR